jgi:hypothetical protein
MDTDEFINLIDGYNPKIPTKRFNKFLLSKFVAMLEKADKNIEATAKMRRISQKALEKNMEYIASTVLFEKKYLNVEKLSEIKSKLNNPRAKKYKTDEHHSSIIEELIKCDGHDYGIRQKKSSEKIDVKLLISRLSRDGRLDKFKKQSTIDHNKRDNEILTHHNNNIYCGVNSIFNAADKINDRITRTN